MAEKNKLKTAKTRGKGGSISYLRHKGGLFYFITFVLIFLVSFQPVAFAARSSAGGGKIAKPDWGKVATNVGISIGAAIVLPALGSGLNAATPTTTVITTSSTGATITTTSISLTDRIAGVFNFVTNTEITKAGEVIKPWTVTLNSLGQGINFANVVTGYSTFVATSQVNRAVGMAGAYYGWKPSTTFITSSFATGTTAGFLNPSIALGEALPEVTVKNAASQAAIAGSTPSMLKGAFIGGIGGLASAGAIVAIDGNKINKGKAPGVGAQIAGMVAGDVGTRFGRDFLNHDTWHKKPEMLVKVKAPLEAAREDFWGDVDLNVDQMYDAVNDIEADLTGNDALRTNYVEQDLPIITDQYGERHTYFLTTEKDGQMILGAPIPDRVVNAKYGSDRYLWEPTGIPNVYRISDTKANLGLGTVVGRLAKGVFVDTFSAQSWPLLASRSLGIYATSRLSEDKQYLAPLVSSLAQSISHPVLSSFAEVYGLDAGRYIGSDFDKLEANIQYAYNARTMAQNSIMSDQSDKMDEKRKEYSAGKISLDEYRQALADLSFEKGKPFDSPDRYIKQLSADIDMSVVPSERDKAINTIVRLTEEKDSAIAIRNAALAQEGKRVETALALDQSLPQALSNVKINKGDLFKSYAWSGMRSGLFEGLISGGVETVFEKNTKNSNPTQKMLLSYAANMSTAALRGIAWDAGWGTTKNLDWYDHWDYVKPQQETQYIEDADGNLKKNPNFDLLAFKISEGSYADDMLRYNRFLVVSGVPAGFKPRPTYDPVTNSLVDKNIEMVTIGTKDKFEDPLGASFAQANTEWANNAFSFGRPLTHYKGEGGFGIESQQVSALRFMDYVGSLRNLSSVYSQEGLASVISHSFTQANLNAAANNIAGTLVQVPGVADTFSLQPERLVKVTGAPQLLYTIQRASFHPGVTESIFRAPFPDPLYGVRPQTGEGDYLRRTQGSK